MSVILFAWELGGGMGHFMQMRPLAQGLAARGHHVFLALRELSGAHLAFSQMNVSLLQAPFLHRIVAPPFPKACTYTQIIANIGFGNDATLAALASAWRNLYRLIRPDLIVFDHAPTALLAARGAPARTIPLGSGFFIPPDVFPLPALRESAPREPQPLEDQENQVLHRVNRLLAVWRQAPVERLGQLFSQATERFLLTFEELDHYPSRQGARYWGPVYASGGKPAEWPDVPGKKIFAYLKNFPALPDLLAFLHERGLPTVIVVDGVAPEMQRRFSSASMRFERQRLDPNQVARACDVAILNANHGMVTAMLLAGKPSLQLPLTLEQLIIARHVRRLGVGLDASPRRWPQIKERLEVLLSDVALPAAAARFAAKHSGFDEQRQREEMLTRALDLL